MTETLQETIGTKSSATETLASITAALNKQRLDFATTVLLTDWQDRRDVARYAVLICAGEKTIFSEAAFGPRYGHAGAQALVDLILLLQSRGATNFKESILAPHEFNRMLENPSDSVIQKLLATANPTDPNIYALNTK